MHIKNLQLVNFKNYESENFEFAQKLNCIVGQNGMGKTNLLDAIYYLSMTKSNFSVLDKQIKRHDSEFIRVHGEYQINSKATSFTAKVIPGTSKVFEHQSKAYDKLSDHVGKIPVVMIIPDDSFLVREGSEVRRKFIDNTLAQLDVQYLNALMQYNKLLKQRNAALKSFAEHRNFDVSLLKAYNSQMEPHAEYIYTQRTEFVKDFIPVFKDYHQKIVMKNEVIDCVYKSKLSESSFKDLMLANLEKDRVLARTTNGIHKDDLQFTINGHPLKKFGSQGQTKSYVLAFKLAQYAFLKQAKGITPILLLDDIFDKLDKERIGQLLQLLVCDDFGQIFISDTHEKRLEEMIQKYQFDYKIFYIVEGGIRN